MESAGSITLRLEAYLLQLADVNHRWTNWLRDKETAVLKLNLAGLETLTQESQALMSELKGMLASRQQLLADAAEVGYPATDLHKLARQLPAWNRSTLRTAVLAARQQLANLRRLHASAWVLIHESAQFVGGTLAVFTQGKSGQDVYVTAAESDTGGGQLLDTNL